MYIYLVYVRVHLRATKHVWRLKDNLQESVCAFPNVGPEDQTQALGHGDKGLYSQSHLANQRQDF